MRETQRYQFSYKSIFSLKKISEIYAAILNFKAFSISEMEGMQQLYTQGKTKTNIPAKNSKYR